MPSIVVGGLAAPATYIITSGLGAISLSASGWTDDSLRDPHLVGTAQTGTTTVFNQWHQNTSAATEAIIESLYNIGKRFGRAGQYVVESGLYDLALKNIELIINQPASGPLVTAIINFNPADPAWADPNPNNWTAEMVRDFLQAKTIALVGVIPASTYWSLTGANSGRLRFHGVDTTSGSYIQIGMNTDPWVLDILGFYSLQLRFAPQQYDYRFDTPGQLEWGLELRERGDGHYAPIDNRYLLNLAADIQTLRRDILEIRDGIFIDNQETVQSAFIGEKRFHNSILVSTGDLTNQGIKFEGDQSNTTSPQIMVQWFTKMPEGSQIGSSFVPSPCSGVFWDNAGESTKFDFIKFLDDALDVGSENWVWSIFGQNDFTGGVLPLARLNGHTFSFGLMHESPGGGGSYDHMIYPAMVHQGEEFKVSVYEDVNGIDVPNAILHTATEFSTQIYDPNYTIGLITNIESNWGAASIRTGTMLVGGGSDTSRLFYRGFNGGIFSSKFTYEFGFAGGSDLAFDQEFLYWSYWLNTSTNVRFNAFYRSNLYSQEVFESSNVAGTTVTTRLTNSRGQAYNAETSLAAPGPDSYTYIWSIDTIQRIGIESGDAGNVTPYALHLSYDAVGFVQTQIVFDDHSTFGSNEQILQWSEGTDFGIFRDIHNLNYGYIHHQIPAFSAPFASLFVVNTPSKDLFSILERTWEGYLGTPQVAFIGNDDDDAKILAFNANSSTSSDMASIAWDQKTHRPLANAASVLDPSKYVGALVVHHGGRSISELDGELADYYRVFTPNDYWWDIAKSFCYDVSGSSNGDSRFGYIALDAALPAAGSFTSPRVLRSPNINGTHIGVVVGAGAGVNVYKYVMEGLKPQVGATVIDVLSGNSYTVVSSIFQSKGTILFKSGFYYPRHRIYFAGAIPGGGFPLASEVTSTGTYNGHGWVIERYNNAGGSWIDLIMCAGRFEVGDTVTQVGTANSGPSTAVVYPFDNQGNFTRENAQIKLLGEDGTNFVTHAGLLRLYADATQGIDFDGIMDNGTSPIQIEKRENGIDLGLHFENITFGGFIPYETINYDNHNEHAIVVSERDLLLGSRDSHYYNLKFTNCIFQDRLFWFHDDGDITTANNGKWNIEVSVENCIIDPEYFIGMSDAGGNSIGAAYLVDMQKSIIDFGSWRKYNFINNVKTHGPSLINSTFKNIQVISSYTRVPESLVVPFRITSLVNVTLDNVKEDWENVYTTLDMQEYPAVVEYFASLNIENCNFRGKHLEIGRMYWNWQYSGDINPLGIAVGDWLVGENGQVGVIVEMDAPGGNTDVWIRMINDGEASRTTAALGDNLIWLETDQDEVWLNTNAGFTIANVVSLFNSSKGFHLENSKIGRLWISGAKDSVAMGDGEEDSDDNKIIIHKNAFSAFYSAGHEYISPLISRGFCADFLACQEVQFHENTVSNISWDVPTGWTTRTDRFYYNLVGFKSCRYFKSSDNIYRGQQNTNTGRIHLPTVTTVNNNIDGSDLYIYHGYFSNEVNIKKDEVVYIQSGNAYVDDASLAVPAGVSGGRFVYAALCGIQKYAINDNDIDDCYSGYGGPNLGTNSYSGMFIHTADLRFPGDTFILTGATTTGYDYLDMSNSDIEVEILNNKLNNCEARRGVNIEAASNPDNGAYISTNVNCVAPGSGGHFVTFFTNSALGITDRTWSSINVDKNKYKNCFAGDAGENNVGTDRHGAHGGNWLGIANLHGGTVDLSQCSFDNNVLNVCNAGDGSNAVSAAGDYDGGNGGSFIGIYLDGFSSGSILLDSYIRNVSTTDNKLYLCYSGDAGTLTNSGDYGVPGSWNLLRAETYRGLISNTYIDNINIDNNIITDCWIGGNPDSQIIVDWDSTLMTMKCIDDVSWALFYGDCPDLAIVLGVPSEPTGRTASINNNKISCMHSSRPTDLYGVCFASAHFNGIITNTAAKVWPWQGFDIKNNNTRIAFDQVTLNENKQCEMLYTNNELVIPLWLGDFEELDVLIEDNSLVDFRKNLTIAFPVPGTLHNTNYNSLVIPVLQIGQGGLWFASVKQDRYQSPDQLVMYITGSFTTWIDAMILGASSWSFIPGTIFEFTDKQGQKYVFDSDYINTQMALTGQSFNYDTTYGVGILQRYLRNMHIIAGVIQAAFNICGVRAQVSSYMNFTGPASLYPRITIALDRGQWGNISQFSQLLTATFGFGLRELATNTDIFFDITTSVGGFSDPTPTLGIRYSASIITGGPPAIYYETWYLNNPDGVGGVGNNGSGSRGLVVKGNV